MTIMEAIGQADDLQPNSYSQEIKAGWLSRLDGMIWRNVICTHAGNRDGQFQGYGADTPLDTQLIAKEPYDGLYLHWLTAKIHLANGEYDRYNVEITLFSDEYQNFENDYNRNRMPNNAGTRFLF